MLYQTNIKQKKVSDSHIKKEREAASPKLAPVGGHD